MTYIKKYGLRLLYTIISILLSLLFLTITYKILKIIILLLNIFINSFILGTKTTNKGYLEGIKFSLIIISILLILTLLLNLSIKPRIILYYLIIIFTSTLGSMIGINKNKNLK